MTSHAGARMIRRVTRSLGRGKSPAAHRLDEAEPNLGLFGEVLREQQRALAEIQEMLRQQDHEQRELRKAVKLFLRTADNVLARQIGQALGAVVRAAYFSDPSLMPDLAVPSPSRFDAFRFRLHSQHEEDGVILAILKEIKVATRTAVEFGCGHNGGNAGMLVADLGFRGLLVDGSKERAAVAASLFANHQTTVLESWVTRDNVDNLLVEHGFEGEIDYLGIDLDGNDFWILDAITSVRPRMMVLEYNSIFGPDESVTVEYIENFDRHDKQHPKGYYGASLTALTRLAARRGYRLVATDVSGVNAFFVRNDLAVHIPGLTPAQAYRALQKGNYNSIREQAAGDLKTWFGERGGRLVEVPV